ncbi:MAG: GIY-YIG nuclease family protein [Bacteroidota bacterium]
MSKGLLWRVAEISMFANVLCIYIEKPKRWQVLFSCQDLEKRIAEHNSGKTKSLKGRLPLVYHYSESFSTRSEAFQREKFFKSVEGYIWLKENKII